MEEKKLHIESTGHDRYYDYITIEGLSVEEMNYILEGDGDTSKRRDDRLVEVMSKYNNDSTYGKNIAEAWRWGYGIYSIRHCGQHLYIQVGNNCD